MEIGTVRSLGGSYGGFWNLIFLGFERVPFEWYLSIEGTSSEVDFSKGSSSEDDYGQVPRKERHRYSSYNVYRDEPSVFLVARINHVGIMKILFVHGADSNTRNWNLKTPLMIAARYSHTDSYSY